MNFSVLLAKFSTGLMDKGIHQNGIFLERNTFDSYPQKIRMTIAVLYFPHSPTSTPSHLGTYPKFQYPKGPFLCKIQAERFSKIIKCVAGFSNIHEQSN